MPRKLKTYRWLAHAHTTQQVRISTHGGECPWKRQLEAVVAAHSKAEVGRIEGCGDPRQLFNLGETWNKESVAATTAKPGTVFYQALDRPRSDYEEATTDAEA